MLELLTPFILLGCLAAAPFVMIACFIAVVVLGVRLIPYAGWIVLVLIIVTVVSGCTKAPPTIEVAGPAIPDQILGCLDEPVAPAATRQRQVASYVLDLAEAGDDCRQKLKAVRSIVRPAS